MSTVRLYETVMKVQMVMKKAVTSVVTVHRLERPEEVLLLSDSATSSTSESTAAQSSKTFLDACEPKIQ
jgi:hypothetical protein